jgi:anti-sigma factor RsiW
MWCRIARRIAEWRRDSDRPLGRLIEAHLARCESCRAHLETQGALADVLHREAAETPVPPGLTGRILAAVAAERRPAPRTLRVYPALIGLATAACAVLGVAILLRPQAPQPPRTPQQPPVANKPSAEGQTVPLPSPTAAVNYSAQAAGDFARAVAIREFNNLAEDAKAAGQVLLASITVDFGEGRRPSPRP